MFYGDGLTCISPEVKDGSLKDHANSSSFSDRSRVNFLRSGGVGPWARGYSLTSRVSRGLGCRMKRGGYDLFVVVVVVTVLVSTHWDSSYWSFAARPEESLSLSSKLTVSLWLALGRRISVVFWAGREPFAGGTRDMMTDEGQGGGDGNGDARGSMASGRGAFGVAGVEVQMGGGSMSVVVPGTGYAATGFRATQAGDGLALTVTLTWWTRPCGAACSQPRVQRAATRFPWAVAVGVGETGGCATPGRSKERRRKFRVQKTRLKRWSTCPWWSGGRGDGDDVSSGGVGGCWGSAGGSLDVGIGDGRWAGVARWESKFCQEEVRLSKTRHEARGTHEALARRTTTNPLGGGRKVRTGQAKKEAGGGAGKGGTAKARGREGGGGWSTTPNLS